MNVLIADPQPGEIRRLKPLIAWEELGFEKIRTAYTREHALELTKEQAPSLLICSTELENEHGVWLAEEMRRENPQMEIIMTGSSLAEGDVRRLLQLRAMDYLKKPVERESLAQAAERFCKDWRKRQQEQEHRREDELWKRNRTLIQELFWKNLCLNRIGGDPEAIEQTGEEMGAAVDKDSPYKLMLITMKNQDEMWSLWGENRCQSVLQRLAKSEMKGPEDGGMVVIVYSRILILLNQQEFETAEEKCRLLIARCREELGAEIFCYISEPAYCERLAGTYHDLLAYSKDDVLRQRQIIQVKNNQFRDSEEIILPKNWEDFLYNSDPRGLVREVRAFLIPLAQKGRLGEQNFRIFQQDMLQLFFSYMEKKERSAHELYDNPSIYRLYKTAILSIDGMCQWVESCGEYIAGGIREEGHRDRLVAEVKDYVKAHLKDEISVTAVAASVHLSPDYTTRMFKQETGMTIREYLTHKRMERAKELLHKTEESVSNVALEVGYDNLSYFIRKFRAFYGITPKQYQKRE